MWCKHCAQDVPGLPSVDDDGYTCPRCGEGVRIDSAHQPASGDSDAADAVLPPAYDSWALDEQLRHIQRRLENVAPKVSSADTLAGFGDTRELPPPPGDDRQSAAKSFRLDAAHGKPPGHHFSDPARPSSKPRQLQSERTVGKLFTGLVTWLSLAVGMTAFASGGLLLGWSIVTGRQDLWAIGIPVALAGQVAMLVGLILKLDRLWHDSRRAAAKLEAVDEQLQEVRTATSLLGTTVGPSSAFYAHLAGGASPQILLSDLKGQLDLLALRLREQG
jgi:hypothetical protein